MMNIEQQNQATHEIQENPKPPVHNHGAEEGEGLGCNERIIGGFLRGACMPDLESTDSLNKEVTS